MTTITRKPKLGMSSAKGIAGFSKTGIKWVRVDRGVPYDDLYIRWGWTGNLPNPKAKVLNTAKAIHQVADKLGFRRVLNEAGLCPKTWFDIDEVDGDYNYPLVVRTSTHHQGRGLWTVDSMAALQMVIVNNRLNKCGYYINEFIDKVAEYRVCVVQGRAVWVTVKTPGNPNDVAWNVNKGGRFDNVRWDDWPLKAVKKSIEAFNLSDLDFGGVDVMVDREGKCYILEINSAPSLTSPYRQECMAKVFDWIVNNNKLRIPLVPERGGYLKYIHPAINPKAKQMKKEYAVCVD
jgi:glutathione synthase/RimK-type ligase-like ATP-grasp enzyme